MEPFAAQWPPSSAAGGKKYSYPIPFFLRSMRAFAVKIEGTHDRLKSSEGPLAEQKANTTEHETGFFIGNKNA
jgi:hypothetical protein